MTSNLLCAAFAATAIVLPVPSVAQSDTKPAQAAEREDDPSKFFWFHKDGATADIANTDIRYCHIQTGAIQAKQQPSSGQGGLIGALVEGIMKGVMGNVEERRMRDAGMRKCMGLYGYTRYQVPEPAWNAMMRGDGAIERLTAYASGPVPTTARLDR